MEKLGISELPHVTLVTGEPAAGKTSLLLQLEQSRSEEGPVAWLTVPPHLTDATTFWAYLLVAIAVFDVRVDDLRAALLEDEPPGEAWLISLANRLGRLERRSTVVIDDVHEASSLEVLESLEHLLEITPSKVSFVIATRRTPSWALAAWRLKGHLAEISSADLRVDHDEIRALVDSRGIALGADEVQLLLERTEGWLGGVQLALLSLETASDPAGFLARFAADDELLTTYLLRDVLARQADEVGRFLLDISILEVATAEMCDEIREASDGTDMLERCRSSSLFISRAGYGNAVYRLHGLFRELLQSHLRFDDRDRFTELHRRASDYFENTGNVEQSLRHALAAEDPDRASRLVLESAPSLAQRGRFEELKRLLSLVRRTGSPESSRHLLDMATALGFVGEADRCLRLLDEVDERAGHASSRSSHLRAASHLARGDVHLVADIGRNLRSRPGPRMVSQPRVAGYGLFLEGVGAFFEGDVDRAIGLFERADLPAHRPAPPAYISVKSWAAFAAVQRGDFTVAEQFVSDAMDRREESASGDTAAIATATLTSADLAWERNRLDDASALYQRARRSVSPMPWQAILVECSRSRLAVSRGEPQRALDDLVEIGKLYLGGSPSPLLVARVAERAVDICLHLGDVDRASTWVHTHAGCGTGELPWGVTIRLATATGRPIDDVLEAALAADEPLPHRVDTLLAAAVVAVELGNGDLARTHVVRALTIAQPQRMIRRFIDAGPEVTALVGELAHDPRRSGDPAFSPFFAAEVFEARDSTARERGAPVSPVEELADQLSSRELDVLELLAKELSYTEIGRELFVSRNTIKTHVQHVYTKLGVANRSAAVELGRSLGLI